MAKLNYTDSGGSTKRKHEVAFKAKSPYKPNLTPKPSPWPAPIPSWPTQKPSSTQPPPKTAPTLNAPPTLPPTLLHPSLQMPSTWPTPLNESYFDLQNWQPPLPEFQPDSNLSTGFESFLSGNDSYKNSKPQSKVSNSYTVNSALKTAIAPSNSPIGSGNLSTNPYISSTPPKPKEKGHQLYSFSPENFNKLPKDTLNDLDKHNLPQIITDRRNKAYKKTTIPILYGTEKLINGAIVSPVENAATFVGVPFFNGLSFLTSAGGIAENKISNMFAEFADSYAINDVSEQYSQNIDSRYPDIDKWGKLAGNINESGGELLTLLIPAAAGAKAFSAASKLVNSSSYLSKVMPYLTNVLFSINSGGKAIENALNDGASTSQAVAHGLNAAAFESFTQNLSGGIPFMGKGKLSELLKKHTDVPAIKNLIDIIGEGGEGALRAFFEPLSIKLNYNQNQPLPSGEELWTSFIQDGASSLLFKFATGEIDFRTKNRNTNSKAQMYIDKGSEKVEAAEAMPEVNRAFGPSYSNSKAQRELLTNSFDRGANKLYNSIEDGADFPLFSQQTRNDFAVAIAEATNKTVFKEQLKIIENTLGEDATPFINGLCEDILNDVGLDLLRGGKSSASDIQNKILNSFTKAVQIAQEYKQNLDFDVPDIKVEPGTLYEKNKTSFKEYSMPKNIKIVNGLVGGKIPVEDFQALRQFSTKKFDKPSVTLGSYSKDANSYIAKAGKNSSYFDMGDNLWKETIKNYNLSPNEMFEYFNIPFLDNVLARNKIIRFSHNPIYNNNFLGMEWKYIKEQLNLTDNNLIKEGDFWYVR